MSREAILNRRLMAEERKNRIRFSDWNRVNTAIGGGWEPRPFAFFNPIDSFSQGAAVDLDDCINRIDGIDWDFDWRDPYHRDAQTNLPLIGGPLMLGRLFSFSDDAV